MRGFRPQNLSQWRPRPPGINFALVDAQSHSLTSIFVNFWTFQWSVGPQFPTLFEKIDPLRPLRPKCWAENDPRLILYSFDFHQNLTILLSFTNQIQLFWNISLFHFKPFQASFSVIRCSAPVLPKCSWKLQTEPCQVERVFGRGGQVATEPPGPPPMQTQWTKETKLTPHA